MKILELTTFHLTLVISLGSAFILFPEDLSALLNVFYSGLPPIRFGMNVTRVGVGFRLGRNVDFQTLVEMGSLITTSTTPPPRTTSRRVRQPTTTSTPPSRPTSRRARQPVTPEPSTQLPDVSSKFNFAGPPSPTTTSASPPRPTSRRARQPATSEPNSQRPDVSSKFHFIDSLWGRLPAVRTPKIATAKTKPPKVTTERPTDSPELPEHDVRENEIES